MSVVLSNGLPIDSLTPAELAAALTRAKAEVAPPRTRKADGPGCILSEHTGACCRCGTPLSAWTDRCEEIPGVAIAADSDTRRFLLGRAGSPAYARLLRAYAR